MTTPALLPDALAPLTALPNWVIWRWETNGAGKRTKVPYQAAHPNRKASSTNASTWTDFPTALEASKQADGIGFCLYGTKIAAFDLDHCRDATSGALETWAQQLIERANSYTEISPSGTGLRIIGFANGPKVHRKQAVANGSALETFRRAERYITVTSDALNGTPTPLANLDAVIDAVVAEFDNFQSPQIDAQRFNEASPNSASEEKEPSKTTADDADKLERAIRTGGDLPKGQRSELVWWVINELLRHGYRAAYIEKVLLNRRNGISAHIYDQSNPRAYAKRQVKKAIAEIDFARGEKGAPYITPSNICIALLKLGVTITYDSFADRMLIDGLKDFGPALDDGAVTRIWLQLDRCFHFRPSKNLLFDVIKDAAKLNSFHPVRDYLDSLTWDGENRLDTWLAAYAGAEDTPYTRAVGKLMLVAAVRRVRQPGCKFDEMVVLESEQGKEKSIGLETMAVRKDWYSDDLPLNAESRRVIESTRGRWIIEAAELAGMRHADVEHLKAFLSRTVDRARMSYDRINTEYLRQCVVVGTTNAGTYLRDTTGNRRYWPIRIEQFDLPALERDRDQLWAEAAACEAAGESIRLDPTLYAAAAEEQTQREVDEPWVDALRSALVEVLPDGTKIEMQGKIAAQSIWAILDLKEGARAQMHNHRMGEAMRKLGWKRPKSGGVVRIEGKVVTGYIKGEQPWRTIKAERTFDRDTGYNLNVWYIDDKDDAAPVNADDELF